MKVTIELSSGKKIKLSQEEYEELRYALGEKEEIHYEQAPSIQSPFEPAPYGTPFTTCNGEIAAAVNEHFWELV